MYLYCVDLESGTLCDRVKLSCDKVFLSHHQGVCLFKRLLAVFSILHQTIHLFKVRPFSSQPDRTDGEGRWAGGR